MNRSIPDPMNPSSPDLAGAVRRARLEQAEQSDAVASIRSAELARLEILHDAIAPLLAQVPPHIDMFDTGITRGDHPRLFIDMIGFVEIDRDGRTYRLVQDTRHGRIVVAETTGIDGAVEEISAYIAHRMVEREKTLAAASAPLTTLPRQERDVANAVRGPAAPPGLASARIPALLTLGAGTDDVTELHSAQSRRPANDAPRRPARRRGLAMIVLGFVIDFLGTVTLLLLLMGLGFYLYHLVRG